MLCDNADVIHVKSSNQHEMPNVPQQFDEFPREVSYFVEKNISTLQKKDFSKFQRLLENVLQEYTISFYFLTFMFNSMC